MSKPAARIGDTHACPMSDGPKPHIGGPLVPPGASTVMIGNAPAARVGGLATCASAPATIATGSTTVLVEGGQAARLGDVTSHGGTIIQGDPTVLIGG